jgi:O-antigen ligase
MHGIDLTGTTDRLHPVSLLGNQDYVSSILGFSGTAALTLSVYYSKGVALRLFHLVSYIFLGNILFQIGPLQGVIAEIGSIVVLFALQINAYSRKYFISVSVLILSFGTCVTFGYFGIGPLGTLLQQISLLTRTFLWRAALLMWIHNPIFGVGIDGYQDNFRKYRDVAIVNAFSPNLSGQSSHNFLLEELSTIGVVGTIAFIIPIFFAWKRCLQIIRDRDGNPDSHVKIALFLNGLLIMSISPISISNAVWFWIFVGLLVGKRKFYSIKFTRGGVTLVRLASVGFLVFMVYASLPPLKVFKAQKITVNNVFSEGAIKRTDMYMSAINNPFAREAEYLSSSSDLIGLNRLLEAKKILLIATNRFPLNYDIRRRLLLVDTMMVDKKSMAFDSKVLAEIDPVGSNPITPHE